MTDLLQRTDARRPSLFARLTSSRATAPALIGLLGLAISLTRIGIPSVWYDEAATVSAATRTLPQLWEMLGNIDAVHGLFYLLMHFVFDLVGYTPTTLRIPSAIAVGLGAALVVVLVRQFAKPRTAVFAGLVFCLLPRTMWMGAEGRSYALTAVMALLLTIVLVRAQHSRSAWWWVLYAALAVVSCLVFVYLALVVVAHGVTMAWYLATARRNGIRAVLGWAIASAAAAAALLPFALEVVDQDKQVAWIEPLGPLTMRQVFRTQWFLYADEFAWAAWILIALGVAVLIWRFRGFSLAAIVLPGIVVPTVALLIATELYSPLYSPRYLSMCLPFVAVAIGVAIDSLPTRPIRLLTLAALVVLAIPTLVEERMPGAKQESTWEQTADLIAMQRAEDPPGPTAIIYGPVRYHATATSRVIAYSYPEAFEGTVDVTITTPAAETERLWETRGKLAESLDRLDDADVAYLITSIKRDRRPSTTETLAGIGWSLTDEWNLVDTNVLRYERD